MDDLILPCIKRIAFNELKVRLHPELELKGIYAIRLKDGGESKDERMYIGSTSQSFKIRLRSHDWQLRTNRHYSNVLQRFFNKYGKDSFYFQIIEIIDFKDDLNENENRLLVFEREQYWIDTIGFKKLFNGAPIVLAPQRREHSLEEIAKRTASIKIALNRPETRRRLTLSKHKLWQDPDYREKFSATWKNIWAQEGYSEKRGDILRESFKNSPEGRARLSISSRRNWQNPEYKKRISEAVKERMSSPETKKIYSERAKKYWADKDHSANRLKSIEFSTASKKLPHIFVCPDGVMHVTDNVSGFCRKFSLCQTGFAKLARGVVQKYKGWSGWTLTSWKDVPDNAIRCLYGDHPDLPIKTKSQKTINEKTKFVQLAFNLFGNGGLSAS